MAAIDFHPKQPKLITRTGAVPEVMDFPETASQSFKAGTPVKLTTTAGTVELAEDGVVGFLGIAMEAASGTTSALVKVQVCYPHVTIIRAFCTNNGTAVLADTLAQGQAYGFHIDSDSVFTADIADTAITTIIYVEPEYDSTGTSTNWGRFMVVPGQAGNIDEEAA